MGEFAIGQGVPRFEDPTAAAGRRQIRRRHRAAGHGVRHRAALAACPRQNQSDRHLQRPRPRPACSCVLTGDDWIKPRLGRPAGARHPQAPRRLAELQAALSGAGEGPRALRRRLRRLRRRRDQEPGDGRGRTDRGRLRDRCPPSSRTADAAKPGAPLVWDDCKDNICFVAIHGDKAKTEAAFASAAHVVKQHLVINRVTTAVDGAARLGRRLQRRSPTSYTIYTTLQRAHPYRAELAKLVLKVPEHKVRVVAPDIGGSFGMKSAIYNEVPLVLLGVQDDRPAGEMDEHALGGVPVSDAQARDNVTDAELALDKDGTSSRFRVNVDRQRRRLSAIGLPGLHRQSRHAGRRLPHAGDVRGSRPRCSPTPIRCGPIAATAGRRPPT